MNPGTLQHRELGHRSQTSSALRLADWLPVCLFFFVLAFDFRTIDGGGSIEQQIIYFVALASGLFGARYLFNRPAGLSGLSPQIYLVAVLIIVSIAAWPLRETATTPFLSVFAPYPLFLVGALLAEVVTRQNSAVEHRMLTVIIASGFVAGAWTFFVQSALVDYTFKDDRIQVLASAGPHIFALALMAQAFGLPQKRLAQLLIIGTIAVIAVTVTRAYLMMILAVFTYLIWVSSARWTSGRNLKAILIASAILLFGVILTFFYLPELFDRWIARLFYETTKAGEVITMVARTAEWRGQMSALFGSINSTLFGLGMGSTFLLDEATLSISKDFLKATDYLNGVAYAGHSYWVYSLYSGGLLTGWIMPAIMIHALIDGFWRLFTLRPLLKRVQPPPAFLWHSAIATIYFAVVIATFSLTFSSNPMMERAGAAYFGFFLIASRSHFKQAFDTLPP